MVGIEIAWQTDGGIAIGFSRWALVEVSAKNGAVDFSDGPHIAQHHFQCQFVGLVFFVVEVDDAFFRSNENIGSVECIDVLES